MTGAPSITRLRGSGRIWALGALLGDDGALERLAHVVLGHWRSGDELVVLGNMLGANGDPVRTLDLLLTLRRRLMAANLACGVYFLRGAQEEMWHKLLRLQFAMAPLDVLDWMLERGMAATIEAYGASVAEGRIACRGRASAIARWTSGLRELQATNAGHTDLLNSLQRAVLVGNGAMLLSAAGIDATKPLSDQGDAFWWNGQGDAALDAALARDGESWRDITRLVRGTGPMGGDTRDEGHVLTVARDKPALAVLDAGGALLERIEA